MKVLSDKERMRITYTLVLILTLLMWFFAGGFLSALLYRIPFFRNEKAGVFIRTFVPHAVMLITLSFSLRNLFQSSVLSLICDSGIDVKKFLTAAAITIIVYTLSEIISGENIVLNTEDSARDKIFFLLLSLFLFLFQTLTEEAVFRALPEKICAPDGRKLKIWEKPVLAILCGIFFTLPHLMNAEVALSPSPLIPILTYFLWGFLSSLLGLYAGSYTPLWAMHWANNVFSVCGVATKGATLSGAPLFYTESSQYSASLPATLSVLFLIIFILEAVTKRRRKRDEEKPD